jgi:predicted DNA-binding transcriptional regulator AlpA
MISSKRKPPTSVSAMSGESLDSPDLPTQIECLKKALTVPQLADFVQLSRKQVYALTARRAIPSYRIAGSIRFDPRLIAKWLRSQAA